MNKLVSDFCDNLPTSTLTAWTDAQRQFVDTLLATPAKVETKFGPLSPASKSMLKRMLKEGYTLDTPTSLERLLSARSDATLETPDYYRNKMHEVTDGSI